jgi:NAD(P)-dependent dehydrogenase (short-subunit alcohol dehydrogenase family)
VPDLDGKVYIVTGSNTGIGFEVARILFNKNATVYMACRSPTKTEKAMQDLRKGAPLSQGRLIFLELDLADLNSVQAAAAVFLSQAKRLDVLFNNAGVSTPPITPPPKTVQGYDLSLGVNCVGTFLFTKRLTPLLADTVKMCPEGAVRVVWLSSFALELFGTPNNGLDLSNLDYHMPKSSVERYGISKVGVWALGVEFARRHRKDGIVSVPINPGNLASDLSRDMGWLLKTVSKVVGYPCVKGAETELWAALSNEVTIERSGEWGKFSLVSFASVSICADGWTNDAQWHHLVVFILFARICSTLPSLHPKGVLQVV